MVSSGKHRVPKYKLVFVWSYESLGVGVLGFLSQEPISPTRCEHSYPPHPPKESCMLVFSGGILQGMKLHSIDFRVEGPIFCSLNLNKNLLSGRGCFFSFFLKIALM